MGPTSPLADALGTICGDPLPIEKYREVVWRVRTKVRECDADCGYCYRGNFLRHNSR